jgi:hypothetical protein
MKLEHTPLFERFSFVISDELSRRIGAGDAGHVMLVRLEQSFSKPQLEALLSRAIPMLATDFGATAVGVDIDFSNGGYASLARDLANWSTKNPALSRKVVWAVGYQSEPRQPTTTLETDAASCEDCSGLSCKVRFTPNPVFGTENDPNNYALALAFPDLDNVNRSSARFVCHSQSERPLKSLHFRLVEMFCEGRSGMVTCRNLQQNKQARTQIYSWYHTQPIDLCQLVSCGDKDLGAKRSESSDLADKIVLVYSEAPSNDEHMTIVGSQKGAEIVASLIENELQFGVALPWWHIWGMKWALELAFTVLMIFLFHWRYTQSWAILVAIGFFVLYVYLVPRLVAWVPDFRNYVLAIILAFWLEVLLKSAWQSLAGGPVGPALPGTFSFRSSRKDSPMAG